MRGRLLACETITTICDAGHKVKLIRSAVIARSQKVHEDVAAQAVRIFVVEGVLVSRLQQFKVCMLLQESFGRQPSAADSGCQKC